MDLFPVHPLLLHPVPNGKDHLSRSAKEVFVHRTKVDEPATEFFTLLHINPTLVQRSIHLFPAKDMMQAKTIDIPVFQGFQLFPEKDGKAVAIAVYKRKMAIGLYGQCSFDQRQD